MVYKSKAYNYLSNRSDNYHYYIQFTRREVDLGFSVLLNRFLIGYYEGTTRPKSYSSEVFVGGGNHTISMNEPLHYGGFTFYQASYSMEEGRPPMSVFSVNFDPGRQIKYLGSLIMVIGIMIMFYMNPHYISLVFKRKEQTR